MVVCEAADALNMLVQVLLQSKEFRIFGLFHPVTSLSLSDHASWFIVL